MPTLPPNVLTNFAARIFEAAGASTAAACQVAASLVQTNLTGHDSHGVIRVTQYLDSIEAGALDPQAEPIIVRETPTITRIDGQRSFGQVAARFAMTVTIDKAKAQGVAASALFNSNHVGRMGEWVEMAAAEKLVGLAFCTASGHTGRVAPHGGRKALLGTNPFAAAVPRADGAPIVVDFATSIVAEGKVRLARNKGLSLREGLLIDEEGYPTVNPQALYTGGALLPIGEHKGYGLSVLMDLLGGILPGRGAPGLPGLVSGNGVLFIALDIDLFRPVDTFMADVATFAAWLKDSPPAPGVEAVLVPGDPEQHSREDRATAIPVDDPTWALLTGAAAKFGVAVPETMPE